MTGQPHPQPYIRGYQAEGGVWTDKGSHRGRLGSWVAVALLTVGFALGGLSIVMGVDWWLMGAGLALMLVGFVLCIVTDILTDVVLDPPHYEPEEPHETPLHKIKQHDRGILRGTDGEG
ncbi:hypothetical protein HNR23_000202 [Nocardiopsis mwathae]|uniref:Uncharacterized protein n=1 Tax=Nocardiopsis mwathae TaxID=1472723 RepID=A0A7W9YDI8_9ACTN|nr:hypothetical protein [Nocardiopsis mwathae]MBB6170142.1 hypothetical protein [Nocardiopsis mwathae]